MRYSPLWDGGSNETAKVTIAQNGTALVENLTDEGDRAWSVTQNGTYNLTHTTYTNGAVAAVLNATFIVTGKDVPFPEGDVTVMGHIGKYDGEGHGITVTAPEGSTIRYARSAEGPYGANPSFTNVCGSTTIWCEVTKAGYIPYTNSATVVINKREVTLTSGSGARAYNGIALTNWTFTVSGDVFVGDEGVTCTYSGTQTIVGSSKNTFDYALKSGTSADNYTISKVEGDLEVTASEIVNPFDPDDPTKPVSPEALAKANCVTNYDGDGHSIEVVSLLNPLIAANNPQVTYSLLQNGTYEAQNPVFTNVVATSVWYRIAADNFKPFTTNALLTISPRSITKATMAAIADQTYTGLAITPVPTVSDERTLIGAAEPTNIITTVDYEVSYADNVNVGTAKIILTGTNNYEGVVTNTFNITAAPIPFDPTVGITATGYTNAYDGAAHGVSVTATGLKTTPNVQYKSSATADWQNASPTYTDVCDTQVWWNVSAPNYQTVEGTIGLKITQAANEWTTTPAIEGWTYGETAKTPVGAAKFGTVSFTYDPTPVGDAGDYTMTASVAGTANYTGLSKDVAFTIAKKTIPGGGDEPGGGEVPPGGLSKYDVTVMYDGEEHTIDTNKIAEAFKTVVVGAFEMQYAVGNGTAWGSELPAWKDVVATSLWYRVTSPNYNDYTHQAKVTVTNRPVTVTSGTKLDFVYDDKPHAYTNLTVTAGSFVAGEGIATSNWATVTTVAEGQVDNAFDFSPLAGTKLENYNFAVVTGKIAIAQVGAVTVTITGRVNSVTYDGTEKSVSGYDIVSISDPLYKATDFKFTGVAATNGTDAGTYPMGLKPSDFVNTNGNFSSVTFNVTDGWLKIEKGMLPHEDDPGRVDPSVDPSDPGQIEDPAIKFSPWDYVGMYDGAVHTVDTNAMRTAYAAVVGEELSVQFADTEDGVRGAAALPVPPTFKDVVATSFWYKVSSLNYEDIIHPCKVIITNRCVTMKSADGTWVWDGKEHSTNAVIVTVMDESGPRGARTLPGGMVELLEGETVETTVCKVWSEVGVTPNDFSIAWTGTAKEANYNVTLITGKLEIVGSAGTYKAVLHCYEDIFMAMAAHVGDRAVVTNEYVAGQGLVLPTDWRGEAYDLYDAWNGSAERTFLGWSATNRWTDIYGDDITWGTGEYGNGRAIGYVPTGLATNISPSSVGDREFWVRWTYVDTWSVGVRDATGEVSDQVKATLDESTCELILTGLVANAWMADGTDPGDSWETFAADTVVPWYNNYRSLVHTVRVSANVTHIGAWAFCDGASLEEVFFEGDVPSCGEGAFANCFSAVGYYPRTRATTWTNAIDKTTGRWKGLLMYCREDVPTCEGEGWYVRMDVNGRAQLTVAPDITEVTVLSNPKGYVIVAPNGVTVRNAATIPQGRTEVRISDIAVGDDFVTLRIVGTPTATVYGNATLDPCGWTEITPVSARTEGSVTVIVVRAGPYKFFALRVESGECPP